MKHETRRTDELFDDCFPGDETLDDDVARAEVVAVNVLPDERDIVEDRREREELMEVAREWVSGSLYSLVW